MQYQLITTSEQLEVCTAAQRQEAVALDTEFVRTKTLTHLGLIQLMMAIIALIDPLAIDNMQPFIDLMENTEVVKVLHRVLKTLRRSTAFDTVPTPVFDTQLAGSILTWDRHWLCKACRVAV